MSGAEIVMADDGVPFDGSSLDTGPLGGAETSFIGLAEGLAERGHRVRAFTSGSRWLSLRGVQWAPLARGLPEAADLYVANRGHRLIGRVPKARREAFWIHNPAGYLLKWRYLWPLSRRRPAVVLLGEFHASTLPGWVPTGPRKIIPYGITACFRALPKRAPPPPYAVFTSNPLRRLDWVLDLWAASIQPRVPGAELHVYSSLATYGGGSAAHRRDAVAVLSKARSLGHAGVVLRPPVTKAALAAELAKTRLFLYGGDPGETFCLAAAEAQAAGLPAVVARSTCLAERVRDGDTGYVVGDNDVAGFADRAVELLTDDALWRRQHAACLASQRGLSWVEAAGLWEALLP